MTQRVDLVLASTEIHTDGHVYRLLSLPPQDISLACAILAEAGQPVSAVVVDAYEVSLLLREDVMQRHDKRLRKATWSDACYHLITFSQALEPDLVGFLARVSTALANAGIPILALAAHSRDHILVPAADFTKAMAELHALQETIRRGR